MGDNSVTNSPPPVETANTMEAETGNPMQNTSATPIPTQNFAAPIVLHQPPMFTIPRLTSLQPEDVINFLHAYNSAEEMLSQNAGQHMLLQAYIDGKIVRELSEVYKAKGENEIRGVLNQIVEDYDNTKLEEAFIILRDQLSWPEDEPTADRAVTKFLQEIKRIMSKEDLEKVL